MAIFNKLFKSSNTDQAKGYSKSLFDYIQSGYSYKKNPETFLNYYLQCSPVFTAVKLIKDNAVSIEPKIFDHKKKEYINHPFLELLNKPNPFQNKRQFLSEYFLFYLLTGNVYTNVVGTGKPVRLDNYNPQYITIQESINDGYPLTYSYSSGSAAENYNRDTDFKENKAKFLSKNGNELIHLKNIDPKGDWNKKYGVSELVGCQLEIEQYLQASKHNNSLLENGCRPSMLISIEGEAGDDQMEAIEESVNSKLKGSTNTGRPLLINSKTSIQQLSQNAKDMDFAGLKKDTMTAIYNCLKIPLAMVSQDSSTFNNLESSRYAFYDNNIIPLINIVFTHLTRNVLSRYPNSENLELTYDPSQIEAISDRIKNEVRLDYEKGLLTRNEARAEIGKEQIGVEGDVFYQPMNLIPVGTDPSTEDNRESNAKNLVNTMSSIKDNSGQPYYTAKEILKAVKEIENDKS